MRIHSPVIVTVSNEHGTGALAIAARVARELGYKYVDQQLPVVVAKRLRVPREAVDASEDTTPSLGERLLGGLERGTPELAEATATQPLDEELLAAVQRAVREYASRGNCVIVGRGASFILGPGAEILRVFMHAPREWRIDHLVAASQVARAVVEGEVDRVDRARTAYVRQWYGQTFGDLRNYDICLDTSRLDAAQCAAAIVAAVRARA